MARNERPAAARRATNSRGAGPRPAKAASADTATRRSQPARQRRATAGAAKATGQTTAARADRARTRSTGPTPAEPERARREAVTLPFVNVRVPVLRARVPDLRPATAQTRQVARAARAHVPSAERVLYVSALGVMAVTGVLEWPVAGALGVGFWLASRIRRDHMPQA